MTVIRFCDYERKSQEPDAAIEERDPGASAVIVILPVIRIERHDVKQKRKKR